MSGDPFRRPPPRRHGWREIAAAVAIVLALLALWLFRAELAALI